MDHRPKSKESLSYSTLFNLESLMNFQLPEQDNDFDYYGNSSQDESRDSQGVGIANHSNGNVHEKEVNLFKKRRWSLNSDNEEKSSFYGTHMTEERYRSMLGEHIQKYKRRFKGTLNSPAQNQAAVPLVKSNTGLKAHKSGNERRGGGLHVAESTSEWMNDSGSQKPGNYRNADFSPQYGTDRIMYEPASLDIGDGIIYKIPPVYDKLAGALNLPSCSDIHVEDLYLKGTLDLGSLAEMMAADKRFGNRNRAGMGEAIPQFESLQARLKVMSASNSARKFSLKMSDVDLNSSIPEGAAGSIRRSILSEGGVLQVYYVKVLEKGDTYEMGLGKTIQAMAFLAHLAEEKNIWGPFLVVAPASVLNNWNEELERFCPELKRLPYWGGLSERTVLRKSINPKDLYRREAKFHILITSYQLLVSDEKYFRRVKWQYMVLDEAQAIKSATSIRWKTLLSFNCRNRLLLTGTPIQNNMAELWALLHFIMPTLFDSHEQFNEWFSKGIENHAEHGGTLNEHQLNRLHSILKPFMLRRVKKDVISELTTKTEVTVHCKLSSRQQAFYQAIKNKISLAELFDSNRGQLNEKRILNLMNIVIQLRKVCNHPELFERSEGSTYLYFGEIPNSLPPPPFGEMEDVYYSGGHNPISYEIPKLVYQEIIQSSETLSSAVGRGVSRESFHKHFNIFRPENVYRSVFSEDMCSKSGNFGFTHMMNLSPHEVTFLATGSFMERLLFSMMRWEQKFIDEAVDFLMETIDDDPECSYLEKEKVRAVTRMLLVPSRSETQFLQKKWQTGPSHAPFEALVVPHQDRVLSNARLLHSAYTYIPQSRAPPIGAHCSDRNFYYKMIEELHDPWVKRLLVGFARTSDNNVPRKPDSPHHLIQEIDSELPVSQPALQLTYSIFGSSPPMRNFDPAKLLTDSGKLQTLDILLKRLRAENHRVLLFAQMTKMLNILEDYMNYRKYRYFRLDGSSTIQDRRDMVKDFQHRSDIFVFLLSTRAGGLGINLTAADTVIFYESDWNPTLDLQAMDRAHRLGQTKDVTVYRLICKETVEEKILLRASQKSTVQNLVMTGGSVGGDLLAPEDVVSLLLDDVQLEQKLKEIPLQVKDKQKKKQPMRGIRVNEDGDASMEDLTSSVAQGTSDNDLSMDPEGSKSSNKKRKAFSDKPTSRPMNSQKMSEFSTTPMDDELDVVDPVGQKPKRPKRIKKNVNEKFEDAFTGIAALIPEQTQFPPPPSDFSAGGSKAESGQDN
ncbi:hypothetical protein AAZV13_03G100000 [Glycine max]